MEIWRLEDNLIFTMGFPTLVRWYLHIESGPGGCFTNVSLALQDIISLVRWYLHIESGPGGCFTVSWALQDIISKFVYCRNRTSCENFKLKLCTCAQSHALGTHTKFQREILTVNVISGIVYFREIILQSLWNNPLNSEITTRKGLYSLGSKRSYLKITKSWSCETVKIFTSLWNLAAQQQFSQNAWQISQ